MTRARVRRALMAVSAVVALAVLWELYKLVVPDDGVALFGARVLPRADDASMPHVWEIVSVFGEPEVAGTDDGTVLGSVLAACWYTLRLALAGFAVGVAVGMALALAMQRLKLLERALLPWIVLSQTVPLVALAPLVYGWSSNLSLFGMQWQPWMSVSLIASYLAFFPVAVGALRGLGSPAGVQVELLRAYAATWGQSLRVLRLPAAIPYIVPALRLGAAGAVIGAIVAEISTGLAGGVGRLIITYAQQATGDPARVYAPVIGAALLGLLVTGAVAGLAALLTDRPQRAVV